MPPYAPENEESSGRRQLLAAVFFVCLAVAALYLPSENQQQVASSLRSSVLRPFISLQEAIALNRMRSIEMNDLYSRVDSLTAVLASKTTLVEENESLRQLLDLSQRGSGSYKSASVIRPGTRGSESMYLLDIGFEQGVRVNAPVFGRSGLVGVIREVSANAAIGMDWTHPDFRVSAMTLDGENYGIVAPIRGAFREKDRLILNGAPYHTQIAEGTLIVTSGLGGIYPRGIPIGWVERLEEEETGWRKNYLVEPAVQPGSVDFVLVAVDVSPGDPGTMSEAGRDSVSLLDPLQPWFGQALVMPRLRRALRPDVVSPDNPSSEPPAPAGEGEG